MKKSVLPVLIVQHAPHEHPSAILRSFESQGIPSLWIHPYRGEKYPTVDQISGIVSLGGPMCANDEHEHSWIAVEVRLLAKAVALDLPIVGICLGGQLLARAIGGRVELNPVTEIGWFEVKVTGEGSKDPILGAAGNSPTVYHWHGDTFHLPDHAVLLAESDACPRQAYRFGKYAYGLQFHPEADHQLVNEWLRVQGVERDIQLARDKHGEETVQDIKTQLELAQSGEQFSLKIVAGIGQLFRAQKYRPIEPKAKSKLEHWVKAKTKVALTFVATGESQEGIVREGRIVALFTISSGEFALFEDSRTLLWPMRLDDIAQIKPVDHR